MKQLQYHDNYGITLHLLMIHTPFDVLIACIGCYVVNLDQRIPNHTNIVKALI